VASDIFLVSHFNNLSFCFEKKPTYFTTYYYNPDRFAVNLSDPEAHNQTHTLPVKHGHVSMTSKWQPWSQVHNCGFYSTVLMSQKVIFSYYLPRRLCASASSGCMCIFAKEWLKDVYANFSIRVIRHWDIWNASILKRICWSVCSITHTFAKWYC